MLRLLIFAALISSTHSAFDNCFDIENAFKSVTEKNESSACYCAHDGTYNNVKGMVITCSSSSISQIFVTLQTLNKTSVGAVRIQNSLVNVLPADIFSNVVTQEIRIESCSLSIMRNNSLASAGDAVRRLSLRNNKLRRIEPHALAAFPRLVSVDLSGNKIAAISAHTFADCGQLEEIALNSNDIAHIDDGAFQRLNKLKSLSLADNRIAEITSATFKGIANVQQIQLQENEITEIDWSAFSKMKKLTVLNLMSNSIRNVELTGLQSLQKLFLSNNAIESILDVKLRELPSLVLLALDKNRITSIGNADMKGLTKSTKLATISLSNNNISMIGSKSFSAFKNLESLSLQNNQIEDLSNNGTPYLTALSKLSVLQLSNNQLSTIRVNELPKTLTHLALDHNLISRVEPRAFEGIALKRIYLNKNKIQFLYQGAFDSFPPNTLDAIDVSSNPWQCVCKNPSEWLPRWIEEAEEADVSEGPLGCLAIPGCGKESTSVSQEEEDVSTPTWIKVAASVLAVVSLFLLAAIVWLYLKDGTPTHLIRNGRADSDLHKLIDNDHNQYVEPIKKTTVNGNEKKKVRFEDH